MQTWKSKIRTAKAFLKLSGDFDWVRSLLKRNIQNRDSQNKLPKLLHVSKSGALEYLQMCNFNKARKASASSQYAFF